MNTRGYDRQKTPQSSAFAPVSNRLQSRPFAVQSEAEESSPQQQETPDLQKQLEKEERFGYNFANVSVVAPSTPSPEQSTWSWLQPRLERNEPGVVDVSQPDNPLLQRMIADIQQPKPLSNGSRVEPIGQKSPTKDALTAHELTHTVQQTGGLDRQNSCNIQKAPTLIQRVPIETPAKDAPTTHPTLRQGATGASVMELQQKLNAQGATPPLKVDGIFGSLTRAAVVNFQKTHQDSSGKPLVADGVVGKLTWGALDQASKPKVEPLAADELILSSDPKDTNEASLGQFRTQVGSKVVSWGLSFNATDVQLKTVLLGSSEKSAVVLKWEASWGTKPVSTDIPSSMTPIDAKASVTGVHQLAGWGKVASGDQTILDSMLGGETNMLSQTSRDHLRPMFPTLSAQSDTEQANTLRGLITDKDAIPSVVDEPVTTAKVEYTLTGPTERKNYAFRGKTADAEEWLVEFKDGIKVSIIAPKAPEPGYHNHTVQQAADAASYLPKANRSVIKRILLNAVVNPDDAYWAGEYHQPDFHSYMTAGAAGVVTIYPDKATKSLPGENYMRGTMIHETGHTWSYKTWGSDESKGKWLEWKKAMDADKVSVSGYAMASIAEDVAETIQIYVSTQGSPRFEEYRQIVPQRFAMLDKEYKS